MATDPPTGARTNTRDALVEAAFEEFAAKGYEAATVAGIATRAGVTTGAVYAHFDGKLDLLLATVGLTPLADIARPVDRRGRRSPATAQPLARGLASTPDRRRVLLLDAIVAARRDPKVGAVLRAGLESYVRVSARALVVPEEVTRLLAVLNLGMTVFAALDARTPPAATFDHILSGLLDPPDGAQAAPLARVRARAIAAARAEAELHSSIAAAVEGGHTLRAVAAASGVSHESVRRISTRRRGDVAT